MLAELQCEIYISRNTGCDGPALLFFTACKLLYYHWALTLLCHLIHSESHLVGHVANDAKDDKASKEACGTVTHWHNYGVPGNKSGRQPVRKWELDWSTLWDVECVRSKVEIKNKSVWKGLVTFSLQDIWHSLYSSCIACRSMQPLHKECVM